MLNKKKTLRSQFNLRLLIILITITVISGLVQFNFINYQVDNNVERQAEMIGQSIEQGIAETDLASRAIEQQIDYKLESISKRISDKLPNQLKNISNEELQRVAEEMGIAGIDIFAKKSNNLSVVKSSDSKTIGFTLKGISEEGNAALEKLLRGEQYDGKEIISYTNDNILILYTAQSGSHEEPLFFKYAYYHQPNTDFIISSFIEANEVYQFTKEVGPDEWINKVLSEHEFAKEIAVLDPRVYADPSLAEEMYPPLKKIVYGNYSLKSDDQILINMVNDPKTVTRIDKHHGEKIYKMFIPFDDGRVIYVAMNYEKMSAPFTNYSLILIAIGFISLVVLFITTTRFFNKIYSNIAKIIKQITSHEKGDFTARSDVEDNGELGQLSQSANKMAETLNHVLGHTREQAVQTERHAYLLDSEANNSVEKVYSMSMEATTDSRESTDEVDYIMKQIEELLQNDNENDQAIKTKIAAIRKLVHKNSNSTTEMTITLSDLLKSLHDQSSSLSEISKELLKNLEQFDLSDEESKKEG